MVFAHHPHGEDKGQACEVFPFFAEVELVGIIALAGCGVDDFVSDEEHGFRRGGFRGVEGLQDWRDAVAFAQDELGEHDARVAVGVAVEDFYVFRGDFREDADGEGVAVAADHSGGDEAKIVRGELIIDGAEEGGGDCSGFNQRQQLRWDGEMDADVGVGGGDERVDEGFGVEEGDAGDLVHGKVFRERWGMVDVRCAIVT